MSLQVQEEKVSVITRVRWIINTIFHQAVGVISVYVFCVLVRNFTFNETFPWHTVLCLLSYMPLMTEAIVVFSGDNVWSQGADRAKRHWLHGGLMFASFALLTVGIFLETYNRGSTRAHFVSVHSKVGFTSYVLFVVLIVLGILAHYRVTFGRRVPPVWIKFLHNFLGMSCYVTGLVSLGFALRKDFMKRFADESTTLVVVYATGLVGFWTCVAPLVTAYEQIKSIFSSF